jgi:hypothetical protein
MRRGGIRVGFLIEKVPTGSVIFTDSGTRTGHLAKFGWSKNFYFQ